MTRTLLIAGAALGFVATAAFAQPMSSQPMPSMSPPPPGAMSQALPTPDFLTAAAQSDQFEVKEGRLAEMRGKSAKVRRMGAMMVKAHTKSTDMMKAAAAKAGMPPMAPPGLDAGQAQMLASLKAAHGADFDHMYVDQQVRAHTKTLGVVSSYVANGPAGPVRMTASKIEPVVQMHLDKFSALQSSMG